MTELKRFIEVAISKKQLVWNYADNRTVVSKLYRYQKQKFVYGQCAKFFSCTNQLINRRRLLVHCSFFLGRWHCRCRRFRKLARLVSVKKIAKWAWVRSHFWVVAKDRIGHLSQVRQQWSDPNRQLYQLNNFADLLTQLYRNVHSDDYWVVTTSTSLSRCFLGKLSHNGCNHCTAQFHSITEEDNQKDEKVASHSQKWNLQRL